MIEFILKLTLDTCLTMTVISMQMGQSDILISDYQHRKLQCYHQQKLHKRADWLRNMMHKLRGQTVHPGAPTAM